MVWCYTRLWSGVFPCYFLFGCTELPAQIHTKTSGLRTDGCKLEKCQVTARDDLLSLYRKICLQPSAVTAVQEEGVHSPAGRTPLP